MSDKCNICNSCFEKEDLIWYCHICEEYFCDNCLEKHYKHDLKPIKYPYVKIIGFCDECEEFFNLNDLYRFHYNHNISLHEKENYYYFNNPIDLNYRGGGPGFYSNTLPFNEFKKKYYISDDCMYEIKNHMPVFIKNNQTFTIDSIDSLNFIDGLYLLSEDNSKMIEIKQNPKVISNIETSEELFFSDDEDFFELNIEFRNNKKSSIFLNICLLVIVNIDEEYIEDLDLEYYVERYDSRVLYVNVDELGEIRSLSSFMKKYKIPYSKINFMKNQYYNSKADEIYNLKEINEAKLFIYYSFENKLSGFYDIQKIKPITIKEGNQESKKQFKDQLIKDAQEELDKNHDLSIFKKIVDIIKILDSNFDEEKYFRIC